MTLDTDMIRNLVKQIKIRNRLIDIKRELQLIHTKTEIENRDSTFIEIKTIHELNNLASDLLEELEILELQQKVIECKMKKEEYI